MKPGLCKQLCIAASVLAAGAVVVIGTTVASAQPASHMHLCVNRNNGNLRVVMGSDSCKKNEVSVDLPGGESAEGPAGPQGPEGPAGPTGATGATGSAGRDGVGAARVVDSLGQDVGQLVGIHTAVRAVDGVSVSFDVGRDGLLSSPAHEVKFYHDTEDCSGQRLLPGTAGLFYQPLTLFGTTGFYAGDPIVSRNVVAQEEFGEGADPHQPGSCVAFGFAWTDTFGPVGTANLGPLNLTAPFSVR
jgi:hypothetical protein